MCPPDLREPGEPWHFAEVMEEKAVTKVRWCTRAILSPSSHLDRMVPVTKRILWLPTRQKLKREESRKRRKRKRGAGGWRGRRSGWRSEVLTYDSHDPLVNIGRRDGSWESARGENKDTRCSGTDNDRRPTDRPREAVRNATAGLREDLKHSRHFCRRRG